MNPSKLAIPALALAVVSCAGSKPAHQKTQPLAGLQKQEAKIPRWGKYSGRINLSLAQGRKMEVLQDVYYTGPDGKIWPAPKGALVDGASIPRVFWSVIGGPWEDNYREASVFHDVACVTKKARWQDAAMMFYTAMRCSGVSTQKAKVMYTAVYRFGPHWPEPTKGFGSLFSETFDFNKLLLPEGPGSTAPAASEPTANDVKEIESWIANEDPDLKTLQNDPIPSQYRKKE